MANGNHIFFGRWSMIETEERWRRHDYITHKERAGNRFSLCLLVLWIHFDKRQTEICKKEIRTTTTTITTSRDDRNVMGDNCWSRRFIRIGIFVQGYKKENDQLFRFDLSCEIWRTTMSVGRRPEFERKKKRPMDGYRIRLNITRYAPQHIVSS